MTELGQALGSRRTMERQVLAEILAELRRLRATSTEAMTRLTSGGAVNGVLGVETAAIGTAGVLTRSYGTPCGCIVVANPGTNTVTVVSGPPQGASAPTVGIGVTVIPASSWLAVPIGGPSWTIYGTAGDTVSVQAFAGLQAYGVAR